MENYQTWRDLLRGLISKPREKARLVKAIGVSASALQHWASGVASPQPEHLRRLLQTLPQHHMLLCTLLAEEFDTLYLGPGPSVQSIAVEFSVRILDIYASASDESRCWSICTAVLSEAVRRLDPQQLGISLRVIQCMASPQVKRVRCLRECASLGTSPWPEQIEFRTSFLGAESLAGHVVASGLPRMVVDSRREQCTASYLPEQARSAVALPILHTGRVAGCLLAASTQPDYFSVLARYELLQNYTSLLMLAFSPEHFYPFEHVALQPMPSLQVQNPYLSSFQQRVLATLKTAFKVNHSLSYLEVQQYVWGEIAEELLQLQAPL